MVKRTDTAGGSVGPSVAEAIGMLLLSFLILVVALVRHGGFWGRIDQWLDNHYYLDAAAAIVNHSSQWPQFSRHFLGLPCAIFLVSKTVSLSLPTALVFLSVGSSLGVCALIHRLYGGSTEVIGFKSVFGFPLHR